MNFHDKVVVFVAGLGAIGYETCKQIIKKDIGFLYVLDVMENEKSIQTLKSMNPKCQVRYIKFDVTNKASIKNAISKIVAEAKYIDILVNGAGILRESEIELMMNVNLIGLINTTYEALPYMDKRKNGRGGLIANIASIAGLEPYSCGVAYSTSKFGVVGFTRCMAEPHYYNTTGVAITAICPGVTESPLKNSIFENLTFDYSKSVAEKLALVKTQSAADCGEHLMRVIEANKNGSFWISDCGNLSQIEFKAYWAPTPV